MSGNRNWKYVVTIMIAGGLVLTACGTPTAESPTAVVPPTAVAAENTPTPEMAPPPGPTAMPQPEAVVPAAMAGQPAAVANYNTWIYGGPGTNYVTYGAFLGGATAIVTGKSEDGAWWTLSVPPAPGGIGWVDGAWVTVSGADSVPVVPTPPVPPTTALVPPAAGDPQATTLVNTYVRSGPSETYPAYGIAPSGSTGYVLGKSQDGAWWVIRLDPSKVGAGYGWVSASTVTASNVDSVPVIEAPSVPAPVVPPPPAAGAPTATAVDYVYVRSGAGTCYLAYGVAAPGATGEVAGKSPDGQWWQVRIPPQYAPDGLGWVSAGYVTASNTGSVPVVDTAPPCSQVPVPPPGTYACYLQSQTPSDYSTLSPNTSFTMTWVLLNTGGETWTNGVLQYIESGDEGELHTGSDSISLSSNIAPGGSYTAAVPALTPDDDGTYGELWQIQSGGTAVCEFWMIINVD